MLHQMSPADRPDDRVIEDDVALDRWYESYQRDIIRKHGKKQSASAADFSDVPTFEG
jgi:hypothetical protein